MTKRILKIIKNPDPPRTQLYVIEGTGRSVKKTMSQKRKRGRKKNSKGQSAWITKVKRYARTHGVTYSQALSACSKGNSWKGNKAGHKKAAKKGWRKKKSTPGYKKKRAPAAFGKWRSFLKTHSGKGLSMKQLKAKYHGRAVPKGRKKAVGRPKGRKKAVGRPKGRKKAVGRPRGPGKKKGWSGTFSLRRNPRRGTLAARRAMAHARSFRGNPGLKNFFTTKRVIWGVGGVVGGGVVIIGSGLLYTKLLARWEDEKWFVPVRNGIYTLETIALLIAGFKSKNRKVKDTLIPAGIFGAILSIIAWINFFRKKWGKSEITDQELTGIVQQMGSDEAYYVNQLSGEIYAMDTKVDKAIGAIKAQIGIGGVVIAQGKRVNTW